MERFLEDEESLGQEETALLRQGLARNHRSIVVEVAYPPDQGLQERFSEGLSQALGAEEPLSVSLRIEPALIAGVRIMVGTVAVDLSISQTMRELAGSPAGDSSTQQGGSNGLGLG